MSGNGGVNSSRRQPSRAQKKAKAAKGKEKETNDGMKVVKSQKLKTTRKRHA